VLETPGHCAGTPPCATPYVFSPQGDLLAGPGGR